MELHAKQMHANMSDTLAISYDVLSCSLLQCPQDLQSLPQTPHRIDSLLILPVFCKAGFPNRAVIENMQSQCNSAAVPCTQVQIR